MTVKEFNKKIDDGEAKILTVEIAKGLIGKHIYWTYFPDPANYQVVEELTIGGIIREDKNTIGIVDENQNKTYIRYLEDYDTFEEPTFICSDADRPVFFLIAE